ncbi:hypothetical protein BX616_005433 [Lobosporangium transversale]|nr:hypothetical protein BX616_005433 [Lobosporangium transversale]
MSSLLRTSLLACLALLALLQMEQAVVSAQDIDFEIVPVPRRNAQTLSNTSNMRFWEQKSYQGKCAKCSNIKYNQCYSIDMKKLGLKGGPAAFKFWNADKRDGYTTLTIFEGDRCDGIWWRQSGKWPSMYLVSADLHSFENNLRSFKISNYEEPKGNGIEFEGDRNIKNVCKKATTSECRA